MNADLVRTAHSPNVTERRDCSTALFDADGKMVAQAETMPVHLGAMPFSVAAAVEAFPPESLRPGDSILLNDPYRGGAHLPDLTLVTPVFDRDGESVVAFAANRAHHADVGGGTAGSVGATATEIYQEGLRIPPVKFERGRGHEGDGDEHVGDTGSESVSDDDSEWTADDDDGPCVANEVNEDVLSLILANVRTPSERRGDLRAQTAANATGRRRVHDLLAEHGETLTIAFEALKDYSERRMRDAIADLPDGTYEFADAVEGDGHGNGPLPIRVTVEIDGTDVRVDFAGTADQTPGPVNAVRAVTASATYYAVRCVTDPEIPPNHGCYRPVEIETPDGSLVDPEPPAAVVGGNLETSQRVTDVVFGALAQAAPESVPAAGQGTMNNVTFGGTDPRETVPGDDQYAFYETEAGGFGAHASGDGLDAVHVHMSNTLNTPVEVLETAYPLRVERYALRPDTGGAGEFRGGLGLRRDVRVRDHTARFSVLADRQASRPYGLAGGEPGASGAVALVDDDGAITERLDPKQTRDLPAGSVVSVRTPGGGGFGDPADRDVARIVRDLRLGKLSVEHAREAYGIDPDDVVGTVVDESEDRGDGTEADEDEANEGRSDHAEGSASDE
ncbi:hydantoinase B/oxoprolinase family protein [Halobaculum sp. MBLA0147]|uniref:hydantoinase B/oxoprolinase family protein n=1 Tax=Halobaculum sp. MBLA0147 TaxID=3079934 RepID=UPI0035256AD8